MESSLERVLTMARENKTVTLGIALTVFAAVTLWNAPARADDVLDRTMPFHIVPSPLASALIEFSSQSGIQVAAADADVSRLKTNGVNGALPIRAALRTLLQDTGLSYSVVGEKTVAIRTASTGSVLEVLPLAGGTRAAPAAPTPNSAQPDPVANETPEMPGITVTAPRPPTEQELAGDSVHQFVVDHATVHYDYVNGVSRDLARWRGGKQSICPRTFGIDSAADSFVTARIRAIAAYVGAPVEADPRCKENVRILFTPDPEADMNDVAQWASTYFRGDKWYSRSTRLLEFEGGEPVQGWYLTTPRESSVLNTDLAFLRIYLAPIWPKIMPHWLRDDGHMSGIGTVILVVDTTKLASYPLRTIADYAAMLTLSLIQSPDHCDSLPSVLDAMSPNCANREKPKAMTAADLAFLKALYYRNYVYGPSPSRATIEYSMMQQFKGPPL
jgi:Secretin and TonB N terminus short domain